jgi:hypothetical protein
MNQSFVVSMSQYLDQLCENPISDLPKRVIRLSANLPHVKPHLRLPVEFPYPASDRESNLVNFGWTELCWGLAGYRWHAQEHQPDFDILKLLRGKMRSPNNLCASWREESVRLDSLRRRERSLYPFLHQHSKRRPCLSIGLLVAIGL